LLIWNCKSTILLETEVAVLWSTLGICVYLCGMGVNVIGKSHRLGILGGGQLGRMFIQEAASYDIHVHVMDNDEIAPSSSLANSYTKGNIRDYDAVMSFGKDKNTLTVEIENVNIEALKELEKSGVKVFPQPRVLEIIKDKGIQKQFYIENKIPTAPFELMDAGADKSQYEKNIPFAHKMRTGGYDGKGVELIRSKEDMKNMFDTPSVVEEMIPFEKELSVIVARNERGETAVYQTVECEFNDANLVAFLFSPAEISEKIETDAQKLAIDVINAFGMVGILAVEMFLTKDGELLVNEVAPRPHNSGHHTIECNVTSQFEQHMRAVLNLPLGDTDIVRPGAMINLIGAPNHTGPVQYNGVNEVLEQPGVHIHLYGKESTKPNRKMGHITVSNKTLEGAKSIASQIKDTLQVISTD